MLQRTSISVTNQEVSAKLFRRIGTMFIQGRRILIPILVAIFMTGWISVWIHVASEDHHFDYADHHHGIPHGHHHDESPNSTEHESHSISDHYIDFDALVVKVHKPSIDVFALPDIDLEPLSSFHVLSKLTDTVFHPPKSECSRHTSNRAPPSILI